MTVERRSNRAVNELVFAVEEHAGGFSASALGAAIFTQAASYDELKGQVVEAVKCHFDGGIGPQKVRLHKVLDEIPVNP